MARRVPKFAVVDLFAGPGGLAEGFSSVQDELGRKPFRIALSVEKERAAHSTLLLRTFLRQFGDHYPTEYYKYLKKGTAEPDWEGLYPTQWSAAKEHALLLELGLPETEKILFARIDGIKGKFGGNTVLIGGPPCQAYSLVGRARNKGIATYVAEEDPKHFLYENYIKTLSRLRPAAFVMENVKGMLSSTLNSELVFKRIRDDLQTAGEGYMLLALSPRLAGTAPNSIHPTDFIVKGEEFGLPQARHRVIIVGVRKGSLDPRTVHALGPLLQPCASQLHVQDVLEGMPRLRSGLSQKDSFENWSEAMSEATKAVGKAVGYLPADERKLFRERVDECLITQSAVSSAWPRSALRPAGIGPFCPKPLKRWILDPRLDALPNNETRSHMRSDLGRYLFASVYAELMLTSPRAGDFPDALAPDHKNWDSGKFIDRFRVQLAAAPSTTVTSHMSKDGHYFIHYDPEQCRSLTVREAARLQTFPDNYLFKGNRTEQYIQVGNAVPPYLARQIGEAVHRLLVLMTTKEKTVADQKL